MDDPTLTESDKRELLRIARATLREYLRSGRIPPGKPHRQSMIADGAAFVTLRCDGALRGCIGTQHAVKPLYRAVQEMSVGAASRDPRFEPLTAAEFDRLVIEISILGERFPVTGPDDIVIGVHGLAVDVDGSSGLLLPQVAVENRLTASQFLERACEKAGAPPGAWRERGAAVEGFRAVVFDEAALAPVP